MVETRTSEIQRTINDEQLRLSVRKRMLGSNDMRGPSTLGRAGGSIVDGLALAIIAGIFWCLWQALKWTGIGIFRGSRFLYMKWSNRNAGVDNVDGQ
jgi:hypothetical protein